MKSKQARNVLRRDSSNLQVAKLHFKLFRIYLFCSYVKLRGSAAILTRALQVQTSQRSSHTNRTTLFHTLDNGDETKTK
jgi:hypothetical protein